MLQQLLYTVHGEKFDIIKCVGTRQLLPICILPRLECVGLFEFKEEQYACAVGCDKQAPSNQSDSNVYIAIKEVKKTNYGVVITAIKETLQYLIWGEIKENHVETKPDMGKVYRRMLLYNVHAQYGYSTLVACVFLVIIYNIVL